MEPVSFVADDENHSALLASLTSLASFDRLQSVPELYGRFVDDCSWSLADTAFSLSLSGTESSEGDENDTKRLISFSLLSSAYVKPRERLMIAQEKLTFLHDASSPRRVTSATLQYLLYSLQLSLLPTSMQRQVSSVLGSLLAVMSSYVRLAQVVNESNEQEADIETEESEEAAAAAADIASKGRDGARTTLSTCAILRLLLRFACGLARANDQWPQEAAAAAAGQGDHGRVMNAEYAASSRASPSALVAHEGRSRDLTGFVLSVLAAYVPTVEDSSMRHRCVRLALSILTRELGLDPLHILTYPERRRHVFWNTYTYLLKSQDPRSEPCRMFGVYGSGLNDKNSRGTYVTGFERMLWGNRKGAGESSHRELIQGFASACLGAYSDPVSDHERVSTSTGVARGAELVPMAALSDVGMDALLNELLQREDANASLSVVRRQAARHGIFCNVPHAMLGCALIGHALLCPEVERSGSSSGSGGSGGGGVEETPFSVPPLPLVLSFNLLYELCSGVCPALLQSNCSGFNEPLEVVRLMGTLVTGMEWHARRWSKTGCADTLLRLRQSSPVGYLFVPCAAVDPPPPELPPGEETSRVGVEARTSHMAAFVAMQAQHNFECIKMRIDKERGTTEAEAEAEASADNSAAAAAAKYKTRADEVLALGLLHAKSCDVLRLFQAAISLIHTCPQEGLARGALSGLLRTFALVEPRSLLLLLRKLVRECPFSTATSMLIDTARSFTQASVSFRVREKDIPIPTAVSAAVLAFVPAGAAADLEAKRQVYEAELERERELAAAADDDEDAETRRVREVEDSSKADLKIEDGALAHRSVWFSPLVLEAFCAPIASLAEQSSSSVADHLRYAGRLAAVESAVSLQKFILLRLRAARRDGTDADLAMLRAFFGGMSSSEGCDGPGKHALAEQGRALRKARKALEWAIKAQNGWAGAGAGSLGGEGAISEVTSGVKGSQRITDSLALEVLAMNADEVLELHADIRKLF